MCFTIARTFVAAISLAWPPALLILRNRLIGSSGTSTWTVIGGWALTTVSGIFSAYSGKTSGVPETAATPTPWRVRSKQPDTKYQLTNLAKIAPPLFVLGVLIGVSAWCID